MKLYGLIGFPLGHSFSERYFGDKFSAEGVSDATYRNFPLAEISLLPDMLKQNPQIRGFNVTIPYKQTVIPFLTSMDDVASKIGAVNCVKITDEGLIGHNTDAEGFGRSLLTLIGDKRPSALVLGTGGASKAVEYALRSLGIEPQMVSRKASPEEGILGYEQLTEDIIQANRLIINTTPLGTFPDIDSCPPIPYNYIDKEHMLFDLVYNPATTLFMAQAVERGAKCINGYDMLVGQAEESWRIWNS